MPDKEISESQDSIKTSKTMREKAQAISKCIINWLKIWRLCFRKKKTKKEED